MHIIHRDLPLCPFLLHSWNFLLTLGSFFLQIPDLWNGARKTWPLIPTRRNHKRRINRNESAGQCDGFLWTLDILTGSIISSDSRFLSSSSFFLLFPPPLLFLSSSETQQVVLWRGCHTVRAGDWREGTPPAPILPCPRPRTNLWTWDPRFMWNTGTRFSLLFSHLLARR